MLKLKLIMLVIIQMILSGCYLHSSVSSLEPPANSLPAPGITLSKTNSLEAVSGSSVYALTPVSGYRVKQSAGLLLNKQLANTPNGYKVYLHVSGRITSEE